MLDYQQRVADECQELIEKISKLNAFIETEKFKELPLDEQVRMRMQEWYMNAYAKVLESRIDQF